MSRRRWWEVLLLCLVASVLSAAASMVYATRVARESEHRWCGLITTLDDTYRATPPGTATGRQVAARIHELRRDLGC